MRALLLTLAVSSMLGACAAQSTVVTKGQLLGPWTSGGTSFDFDIRESTILYEFDMQEHPYTLEDDVLVIDFRSASLGIQRKRIVTLTPEVLVLQDERTGSGTEFHRMQ